MVMKLNFTPRTEGEKTGLVVMGMDYAYISVRNTAGGLVVSQAFCKDADKGGVEKESAAVPFKGNTIYLRVKVSTDAACEFSYSADGKTFNTLGEPFKARQGRWIGAKLGLFALRTGPTREYGYADFDWFRFE